MLLIIKFLASVFSVLNSEVSPGQIAAGFAYGILLGLIPAAGLIPLLLLLMSWIINFNLVAVGAAALLFKILSYLVDPLANHVGYAVLTKIPGLTPFWTKLFNMPLVPYTRFNNTIVMGSLIIGVLMVVPVYFLAKKFVFIYRSRLKEKILKFKIMQIIKASSFYKYYESFQGMTGR